MVSKQIRFADCLELADVIREAMAAAWRDFCAERAGETPYAFALIGGQSAQWIGYALATDVGLMREVIDYEVRGYCYQPRWEWEEYDNREKLARWLRWENPDAGWYYGEFANRFQIVPRLQALAQSGRLGIDVDDFEEFCTDIVLAPFKETAGVRQSMNCGDVVFGFTWGQDPRDFVRTATRVNPFGVVRKFWGELCNARDLESQIIKQSQPGLTGRKGD